MNASARSSEVTTRIWVSRSSVLTRVFLIYLLAMSTLMVEDLAGEARAIRVLFVGNSLTYFNNMPTMLETIAEQDHQRARITTEMSAEGGRELSEALEIVDLEQRLKAGNWDYVVLQEQSRLGSTSYLDGRNVIDDPEPFFASVRQWNDRIRRAGATPILLSTWLEKDEESLREWDMIGWSYREIGRELGITVIGADLAWREFSTSYPDLDLYAEDRLHPSPLGSLLVAALCHQEFAETRELPVSLPASIRGERIEEDEGRRIADEVVELGSFSSAELAAVRETVSKARFSKFEKPRPTAPPYPSFSDLEGGALSALDYVGRWQGRAEHYPKFLPWPGSMTLDLVAHSSGKLSGSMSITFEDSKFEVRLELEDPVVEDGRLIFEDPHGPEGATVRYVGVLSADGELRGIAMLTGTTPSLQMSGGWYLRRSLEGTP